jgi:hypothetical protein
LENCFGLSQNSRQIFSRSRSLSGRANRLNYRKSFDDFGSLNFSYQNKSIFWQPLITVSFATGVLSAAFAQSKIYESALPENFGLESIHHVRPFCEVG